MYIDLDFIPDTIVYFKRIQGTNEYAVRRLWGEKDLFFMTREFFTAIIPKYNDSVILLIQKNTLRFKVFEVQNKEDESEEC